jgi:hypothetical protein
VADLIKVVVKQSELKLEMQRLEVKRQKDPGEILSDIRVVH